MRLLKIILIIAFGTVFMSANTQTVRMTIEGIRSKEGNIQLGIFTNQAQFSKEEPPIEKIFPKTGLKSGVLIIEFNLKPGNYAIAVLDDIDKDGDMSYNLIGIPTEGFGFSNYVSSGMRKPKYNDFSFDVKKGVTEVTVKMRYIL